jgi:hypothetical protein
MNQMLIRLELCLRYNWDTLNLMFFILNCGHLFGQLCHLILKESLLVRLFRLQGRDVDNHRLVDFVEIISTVFFLRLDCIDLVVIQSSQVDFCDELIVVLLDKESLADWQGHFDGCAHTYFGLQGYYARKCFHQVLGDEETQTGAFSVDMLA